MISWIKEAITSGARAFKACFEAGISIKTFRRWQSGSKVLVDKRPNAKRLEPSNKLTDKEKVEILNICNSSEFASLPPTQIVPRLADKNIYIASESSFYRVLHEHGQLQHRGRAKRPVKYNKPKTYVAKEPNQVYSWDITYCPTNVKGLFYYLYMIEDIYSRKIVGFEVHEKECGVLAAELMQRTVLSEKCLQQPLVLHSDNGAPMKSATLLAKLDELGIIASRSRPSVSNDNPYSESLFKTMKYRPLWPKNGFKSLNEARDWVQLFVNWYNNEHRHSKIKFVTPSQRHDKLDESILINRNKVYQAAKASNPSRWSGNIRNWQLINYVSLNPEKDKNEHLVA